MNDLQVFDSEEFGQVRTVTIDGEPWLVGKDVAAALGYENTKDAIAKHVDSEDKQILQRSQIATLENHLPREAFSVEFVSGDIPNRGLTIINESGLYSLIFGSKLPSAKRFKHWVTSEVLPAIRKTGSYGMKKESRPMGQDITDNQLKALQLIVECPAENLPYIELVLNGPVRTPETEQFTHTGKTFRDTGNVGEFISGKEFSGRPTHDVYEEYKSYCNDNNIQPLPHVVFSKIVNQMTGSEIIYRRILGKTRRTFK